MRHGIFGIGSGGYWILLDQLDGVIKYFSFHMGEGALKYIGGGVKYISSKMIKIIFSIGLERNFENLKISYEKDND